MKILLIKLSSFGDIVHTFPAVTDAANCIPNLSFDWVVEENFADLPILHPAIQSVICIALRRWKYSKFSAVANKEISKFFQQLRSTHYDLIIDAQGLFKSAVLTTLARGPSAGFDYHSARESWASLSYHQKFFIPQQLHAIERLRQLLAKSLGYSKPTLAPNFGLQVKSLPIAKPYLIFIPATTWPSKHWPTEHWAALIFLASTAGYTVFMSWYTEVERCQVEEIINMAQAGELLPQQNISITASWLAGATGVIGVDTGLTHLAAALNTPTVILYGPTPKALTGAVGSQHINLQEIAHCIPCRRRVCTILHSASPQPLCLINLLPTLVWETMIKVIMHVHH